MTAYIELGASWLFANQKGRDAKAFATTPAFKEHWAPTIHVTSPDLGDDTAEDSSAAHTHPTLPPSHMAEAEGLFPSLRWDTVDGVKQWLVVAEDPDAPLPTPVCHGSYLGIPAEQTALSSDDFKPVSGEKTRLQGGFYYGKNLRGVAYVPPRPLMNHGIHRYFYNVIALNEPLDETFIKSKPGRDQIAHAIQGKVIAWGRWVGQCERRWS